MGITAAAEKLVARRSSTIEEGVDEDLGDLVINDGWVLLDLRCLKGKPCKRPSDLIVVNPDGMHADVKNDYVRYGVVAACGNYIGREGKAFDQSKAAHFPLPKGTLILTHVVVPYMMASSFGMIRTEQVMAWCKPGEKWLSWLEIIDQPILARKD